MRKHLGDTDLPASTSATAQEDESCLRIILLMEVILFFVSLSGLEMLNMMDYYRGCRVLKKFKTHHLSVLQENSKNALLYI